MKIVIKVGSALVLTCGLLAGGRALAQTDGSASTQADSSTPMHDHGPRPGGIEHRLSMLQRELNLSTDQTASVRTLLATEQTQMEALRSNSALTADERHTQMSGMRQEFSTKMHALLTTEQATKFDAMEARMRQHRPGPDGPPPPPAPGGPGGVQPPSR